jgi:ABC-type multidrug transport system ATPase subunit
MSSQSTLAKTAEEFKVNIKIDRKDEVKQFTWTDVCLQVPVDKKENKQILKNITGNVRAGEIVAIMGGSGAGKSSLLNTLAGRLDANTILSGDILVDGKPRSNSTWKSNCAYVEQDDLMYESLTVFETLLYSARLRLANSNREQKIARVNLVIAQLGLEGCRDTKIGSAESRGISGGERKRVSIGIELVTDPHILFLVSLTRISDI